LVVQQPLFGVIVRVWLRDWRIVLCAVVKHTLVRVSRVGVAAIVALIHDRQVIVAGAWVDRRRRAALGRAGGGARAEVAGVHIGVQLAVRMPQEIIRVAIAVGVLFENTGL